MNRRFYSLLVRYSLPILLSTVLLGSGAVLVSNRFVMHDQEKRARLELEQAKAYYEVMLEELDSLNLMFSTNTKIILQLQGLMEVDQWAYLDWRDIKILSSYIASPANARPYVDSIYIYLDNNRRRLLSSRDSLTTIDSMGDGAWYGSYEKRDPSVGLWTERRSVRLPSQEGESRDILSIYRAIYSGTGKRSGVIVLNLLAKKLEEGYPRRFMGTGDSITISDADGRPLLFLAEDGGSSRAEKGGALRFSLRSNKFGWDYEMSVPKRELYRLPRTLALLTVILSLAAALVGLVLTYRAHLKEERFIQNALDLLSSARGSRIEPENVGGDADVYDYMLTGIISHFLEHDYMRVQKEAMEYRALQMQINPHFLFNTIETINWRAIKLLGDPNDVSSMLFLMSKILKYAMDIGDTPSVPLAHEIEHARCYLELQAIRFPGRFSSSWEIEDGLEDFPVPRLLFQPLLENSFNHGLPEDGSRLELRVRAALGPGPAAVGGVAQRATDVARIAADVAQRAVPRRAILEIEDNGRGISAEEIARVESLGIGSEERRPIGLANVRKRLALLYRGEAAMSIGPGPGGKGTRVVISIAAAAART
jgi:Predicted signal transduction protein with a C-terminal ATPase domain